MSKKVVILGAAGRMGRTLIHCILSKKVTGLELVGAIDLWDDEELGKDVGLFAGLDEANVLLSSDLNEVGPDADVIIDFSSRVGTVGNADRIVSWGSSWIIGTTGFNEKDLEIIKQASNTNSILLSGNMSLGIAILSNAVEAASRALKNRGFDIEIIERHHNQKKDAPSGTALMLGEAASHGYDLTLSKSKKDGRSGLDHRLENEIGFHAVRGGDIIGDHSVLFAGLGEQLEFSHRATNRDIFALGALQSAIWISDQEPGLYSMQDILDL